MPYWFDVYFGIHSIVVRMPGMMSVLRFFDGMLVISRSNVFYFLLVPRLLEPYHYHLEY